jgi:flagella basal body P-ring formation protein FlgA
MMNFLKKTFFSMLTLLLTGWVTRAIAAESDLWKLLPQAQVDSSGVFLDELVSVSGTNQIAPHIRLAPAPRFGQTVSFSRNALAGLAQVRTNAPLLTNWTGAAEVRVSRRLRTFEDSDLIELLTAVLQKEYVKNQGELELHLTRPWVKPQVPDEVLTLKVGEMPARGVSPNFVAAFELWDGKERIGNWQVPIQAAVWRDIPVAHSTLQRGEALKDADITMERSDVLVQRDAFMNFPTTDESLELTESISEGHPVLNRSVRIRPTILRGQMVDAVFQDGSLGISLVVETLEDGVLGQTVRVRNPKTRREIHGKVENEKTIRINL